MSRMLHPVRKSPVKARRRRAAPLRLETLEDRVVPDVRSITGLGNNIANPTWGQSGTDLLRVSPVAYADGASSPSQPNALSPRQISNNLNNQSDPIFSFADNLGPTQTQNLTDFSYVWGQFIDHDMDLTLDNSGQAFNIPGDPTRPNDQMGVEPFTRSQFDPKTGQNPNKPRQQVNAVTAYLDLSQVYGSTDVVADALRTHSGGLLKTSPGNLLPFDNTNYFTTAQIAALNMANDAMQVPTSSLFAAGDRRANENIELTALTTLFVRNHNSLARQLAANHPSWTDEQLYQEARKLNIAEEEIITYTAYLPSLFGTSPLPGYNGYNPNVNAGIATEFSTVGFRFGHSQLDGEVERLNNDGTDIADVSPDGADVSLVEDFFRPDLVNNNGVTVNLVDLNGNPDPHTSSGIGAILKANASGNAQEVDLLLVDEVRNVLFGIPNAPGTDLAARDIQRARDHGIGTYNQVRVAYGLPAVTSFAQISSNPQVQQELRATYGTLPNGQDNVNAIDPFEGMLAEDHVAGADAGPTIKAILAKQFAALRDGDRFFYLNESFNSEEAGLIQQGNTLAEVIENNTAITNLQSDVFFFKASVSGTVYADPDGDGFRGDTEPGLAGITVNLLDDSGNVVASTKTDAQGHYTFTNQTGIPGTGNFTLSLSLPSTLTQTAAQIAQNPGTIAISRGDLNFNGEDFAVLGTQVNFLNGFASTAGLQLNGSAKVAGSRLRLTDGGAGEAGSAFTTNQVFVGQFSTFFTFQLANPNADGITFTIQRQSPTALGSAGGGLGYATDGSNPGPVISHSAAIKFDLYNNQGEGPDSTGLYFNGAPPTVPAVDLSNSGINLHSGDVFEARIVYVGTTLTLRVNDDNTGAQVEVVFTNVNIPAAIGGNTAFVGFTGGTGALTATQDILAWDFTPLTAGSSGSTSSGGSASAAAAVGGTGGSSSSSSVTVQSGGSSADVGSGGTATPPPAAPQAGSSASTSSDPALVGGNTVSVGTPAAPPSSANVVTVSGGAAASSQVTAVLVQPSGADSGLALQGAADAGASTPSDPLAPPVSPLDAPGVTVL
jgi:peroxidase